MSFDPIRILIVDDQRLLRDGLRILLELEEDMEVVGEAENGADALEKYAKLHPDVILMDIRMPVMDGVEAIRKLHEDTPEAKVIILTTFDDDAHVFDGLRAGALGYLLKDVSAAAKQYYHQVRHSADAPDDQGRILTESVPNSL